MFHSFKLVCNLPLVSCGTAEHPTRDLLPHKHHTQKRFCNIHSCIGSCLVAQHTEAEIWSNML